MDFSGLDDSDLIKIYGVLLQEMKHRSLIRSKNVVGDIGEHTVIEFFNNAKNLPKLQAAPPSTKNIDAISTAGERYSIKSTTTNTTGTFWGITKDVKITDIKPLFEYVIILQLDEFMQPLLMLQASWETFFKFKHWHSRMNAYNLIINKSLINNSVVLFKR